MLGISLSTGSLTRTVDEAVGADGGGAIGDSSKGFSMISASLTSMLRVSFPVRSLENLTAVEKGEGGGGGGGAIEKSKS